MTPTTTAISTLVTTSPFWTSLWSDLLSGFILLLVGSFFIPIYLRFRNRPKMILKSFDFKNSFTLKQDLDKVWRTKLVLRVYNRGNKTIERFYWEIFIEKETFDSYLNVLENYKVYPQDKVWGLTNDEGKYLRIHGYLETPIFPLESVSFPYYIPIKSAEKRDMKIYYYFKTDNGQLPFWSWLADYYKKYEFLKKLYIN